MENKNLEIQMLFTQLKPAFSDTKGKTDRNERNQNVSMNSHAQMSLTNPGRKRTLNRNIFIFEENATNKILKK